ncbi:MAG: gluconokinase [Thainema sp.]
MIVILMGVSGSGKTVVGKALAQQLGWIFYDADDCHTQSAKHKMAQAEPLTDADREPWLERLRQQIEQWLASGTSVVLACSALKSAYRHQLKQDNPQVQFVYLHGSWEILCDRISQRDDHFMPSDLLNNQLDTLEEPEPNEAFWVDIKPSPSAIAATIANWIDQTQRLCT